MATTMYLRNRAELAAAARVLRRNGYDASVEKLKAYDRYVANIVSYYEPGHIGTRQLLEDEIVEEVAALRERKRS